jgi:hypothetical protein
MPLVFAFRALPILSGNCSLSDWPLIDKTDSHIIYIATRESQNLRFGNEILHRPETTRQKAISLPWTFESFRARQSCAVLVCPFRISNSSARFQNQRQNPAMQLWSIRCLRWPFHNTPEWIVARHAKSPKSQRETIRKMNQWLKIVKGVRLTHCQSLSRDEINIHTTIISQSPRFGPLGPQYHSSLLMQKWSKMDQWGPLTAFILNHFLSHRWRNEYRHKWWNESLTK